jgi:hypothetical protein
MRSIFRLLLLGAVLAAAGCNQPDADPERAFRHFVDRVQRRDAQGAWNLLAPATQEQFTELVRQRSRASGGAIPDDPQQVILGNAQLARPIETIEVVESSGDRAVLRVVSGGAEDRVTLVRTAEGWRVLVDVPPEVLSGGSAAGGAAGAVDAP